MSKLKYHISFIGSGNMGSAIIRGFVSSGVAAPDNIAVFDKCYANYAELSKLGIGTHQTLENAIQDADLIFLCVKPQDIVDTVTECCSLKSYNINSVLISIAASVTIETICNAAGKTIPVIRTMPNTPMLIGEGAVAVCKNDLVDKKIFANVCQMFSTIATVSVMDESLLNPIISVSGSSPAYVYYFIRAVLKGATEQGISQQIALPLIIQTFIGAAKMVESSDCEIDDLINRVCSPRGTTLEAMNVLREKCVDDAIIDAMRACSIRADQISEELMS